MLHHLSFCISNTLWCSTNYIRVLRTLTGLCSAIMLLFPRSVPIGFCWWNVFSRTVLNEPLLPVVLSCPAMWHRPNIFCFPSFLGMATDLSGFRQILLMQDGSPTWYKQLAAVSMQIAHFIPSVTPLLPRLAWSWYPSQTSFCGDGYASPCFWETISSMSWVCLCLPNFCIVCTPSLLRDFHSHQHYYGYIRPVAVCEGVFHLTGAPLWWFPPRCLSRSGAPATS